jgi:hypothetical protein
MSQFDIDHTGDLSRQELQACVAKMGFVLLEGYIDGVWDVFDTDASGTLSSEEFEDLLALLHQRWTPADDEPEHEVDGGADGGGGGARPLPPRPTSPTLSTVQPRGQSQRSLTPPRAPAS